MRSIRHSNDLPGIVAEGKEISKDLAFCIEICRRNNERPRCSHFGAYYGSDNLEQFDLTLTIKLEYQMTLKQFHYPLQLSL